jgi:hypothetical protein
MFHFIPILVLAHEEIAPFGLEWSRYLREFGSAPGAIHVEIGKNGGYSISEFGHDFIVFARFIPIVMILAFCSILVTAFFNGEIVVVVFQTLRLEVVPDSHGEYAPAVPSPAPLRN